MTFMKILFQGDSITDSSRDRQRETDMGKGYPLLVKANLGQSEPLKYEFVNRGISGNRVVDLYARIKKDIINIEPDVMSILIGVNDVWHDFTSTPNGVDAEKYFKIYSMLIEEIKQACPDTKIMIMEPFALCASATEEKWPEFSKGVLLRAKKAKEIAKKFNLVFIPLQDKLDNALKLAPAEYWLGDGVHPTPMGHELIKNEWIKAFKSLMG